MDETLRALNEMTESISRGDKKYSGKTARTVADKIRSKLQKNKVAVLTKRDVDSIRAALNDSCNSSSLALLHHDCFNTFVHALKTDRLIDSPYINTLIKTPRYLLSAFDASILDAARAIGELRNYLLKFNVAVFEDIAARETEHYCTAYAAWVIFGQMTFPLLYQKMFTLKKSDFAIDPAYFKFNFDDGDTYYRYFLPAPAAIYTQRLLLLQCDQRKPSVKSTQLNNNELLLVPQSFKAEEFPSVFCKWLHSTLSLIGSSFTNKNTLSVFSRASVAASISDYSADDTADTYSPFILAVQSRVVKSFSYDDHYLGLLLRGREKVKIDHCEPPRRLPKRKPFNGMSPLDYATDYIQNRITSLKRHKLYKMSDRILAAHDLSVILDKHKLALSNIDYDNLGFYVRWLSFMLRDRSIKINKISGYLSNVPVFLDILSDEGEFIDLLCKAEFIDIASGVMSLYHSPGIRDAIKTFSEYVKCERPDFDMPDWQHTKKLYKPYIPTPKPLIDYADIETAISASASFFGMHEAQIVRLFIYLGGYAGMRVMEIANLRVHNVIYDDGVVICVRTTKTENGIRNIHLSKLAPAWIVDYFLEYWRFRRSCDGMNGFIFVNCKGEPLAPPQVSSAVAALFKDIGMAHIRFHFLRHLFQNFFILRWLFAFYPGVVPPDTPFLKFELFNKTNMDNFRIYFLGLGPTKIGQDQFTNGLATLSRTVGHAFASVTESTYLHNIDWLFYLLSRHWDQKVFPISTQKASDLLQMSYYLLPSEFKGRGKKSIKLDEVVKAQALRLKEQYEPHNTTD